MPAPPPVQTMKPRHKSLSTLTWLHLPRRYHPCTVAASVRTAANRSWREASKQSLAEQRHLMSSVVSLFALNPLVLPAILLAWLLTMSKLLTKYPVVRTLLYLCAVCWSHMVIGAIRAVTPTCFIYASYALVHYLLPSHYSNRLPIFTGWVGYLLLAFSLVEVYFYFHTVRRCSRLQARVSGPEFSNARRWLVFRRVEESSHCVAPMAMPKNCVYWRKFKAKRPPHPDSTHEYARNNHHHQTKQGGSEQQQLSTYPTNDHATSLVPSRRHPLEFLRGWFYNLPLHHIKHDNLMSFFSENCLGMHLNELSPLQRDELEEVVSYIQLKASRLAKQPANSKWLRPQLFTNTPPPTSLTAAAFKAGQIRLPISSGSSSSASASPSPTNSQSQSRAVSTSPENDDSSDSGADESRGVSPCVTRRTQHRAGVIESDPSSFSPSPSPDPSSTPESATPSSSAADFELDWDMHLSLGTLPPGHEPDHDPMALNLKEITYLHRPLAIYLGVRGLGMVAGSYMRYLGFTHHTKGKLSYWYRRAVLTAHEIQAEVPRADPVVMIHGIGIGPFTYLHMLSQLYRVQNAGTCSQRSMYMIELPYISMQLGHDDIPSPHDHVTAIAEMLYSHEMAERELYRPRRSVASVSSFFATPTPSLDEVQQSSHPIKAVFVGHSYGTFVVTWVIKNRSDLVAATVLIDPVCFMVFDPSLIYNFIYRTPFSLVTNIYHYFTSRELGISYTLCRHFWWYENILWREEFERIGMTPSELESSLIAERDQCVASLPYHELLDAAAKANGIEEETEEEVTRFERAQSDSLVTPKAAARAKFSSSFATVAASSAVLNDEHPLCPPVSLGSRVYVYLASNDDITPSVTIQNYLQHCIELEESKWGVGEAMVKWKLFEGVGHAECLFHTHMREEMMTTIQSMPTHQQFQLERMKRQAVKRSARTPM